MFPINGRLTLNNTLIKITRYGNEEKFGFNENEFETKLKQYFDIDIRKAVANNKVVLNLK